MPLIGIDFDKYVQNRLCRPPSVLYRYTSLETAKKTLEKQMLRFRSPTKFNDPFDSQWDPLQAKQIERMQKEERSLLEHMLRSPGSYRRSMNKIFWSKFHRETKRINKLPKSKQEVERRRLVEEYFSAWKVPEEFKQRMTDLCQRLRVLCFSSRCDSILMWSHYGGQHTGVVFGFASTELESAFKIPLEKVEYSDELPFLVDEKKWARVVVLGQNENWVSGGDGIKWALTKSSDWNYEQEWRIVWAEPLYTPGTFKDQPLPKNSLVEVIFGCKTPADERANLIKFVQKLQPKIQSYNMNMNMNSGRFELTKTSAA